MPVPAALVAVPLIAGCGAGVLLAPAAQPSLALLVATASILAALAAAAWHGDDRVGFCVALFAATAGAGTSMGLTAARRALEPPLLAWFESLSDDARGETVRVDAVLRADAALTDYGASLDVEVVGVAAPGAAGVEPCCRGGLRLSVTGESAAAAAPEWRAGRTIRVPASLRLPTVYRNPGLADARRAMALRGIVLVGSVKSAALVEVVAPGNWFSEAAAASRAWVRHALEERVGALSPRSGAIASAILINDRSALDPEDERRLQEAGTYHVIAISGGNIAILTVLLLAVSRGCGLGSAWSAALSIAALIFYAALTGAPASVTRAVTAAISYLAGRIIDQRGPPLNALAVAAIVALAAWPTTIADAGFLLSFGATLGILVGTERLVFCLAWWRRPDEGVGRGARRRLRDAVATGMAGLFAATVCAELALAPIAAAYFGRITIAGLLVNFAAVPLMTLTQLAAMATLVAPLAGERMAAGAAAVTHAAAWGLVESARLVDLAPWMARDVGRPGWTLMAAYYVLGLWLLLARRRVMLAGTFVGGAYVLLAAGPAPLGADGVPARPHILRAVFLDVGQGDATLVTLPDGRALLVDAGGIPDAAFDIGRRVVAPSLRALGVRHLDELIVTHADADHIGGALGVARAFRPRAVREGAPVPRQPDRQALAEFIAATGGAWRTVQAGDVDRVAGVDIRVWHPPLPDWERQRVRNDDSIVLEFRYGDVSIVLPGDIGQEPEALLAPQLELAPLVILKAPHHGSASSSTAPFVRATAPTAVLFSAGRNNPFGHPHPTVTARYRAAGAYLFRTDQDGAVIVETDGRRVEIRTMSGRRVSLERH